MEAWVEKVTYFQCPSAITVFGISCGLCNESLPQKCIQMKWAFLTFSINASLVGAPAENWAIVLNDYDIRSFLVSLKIMPLLYFLHSDFRKLRVLPCYYQPVFLRALCVERYVLSQVIMGHMNMLHLVSNWGQHNFLGWNSCRSHQMILICTVFWTSLWQTS